VTASRNGDVLAFDRFSPDSARSRRAFVKAVCQKCEDVTEEEIEKELLRRADELQRQPPPEAVEEPRPAISAEARADAMRMIECTTSETSFDEDASRLLSLRPNESAAQTRAVIARIARDAQVGGRFLPHSLTQAASGLDASRPSRICVRNQDCRACGHSVIAPEAETNSGSTR